MMTQREYYGPHLILDCWDGCYADLRDGPRIERYLVQVAHLLKMHVILGPYVRPYWPAEAKTHDDWGISGFVMFAESHMSIHTYPEDHAAFIDVFSCSDIDVEIAVNYTRDIFGFGNISQELLKRGRNFYPRRQERQRRR